MRPTTKLYTASYLRKIAREEVELRLGRTLTYNEIVHHKDGNLLNWSIDNLEVISRANHATLHTLSKDAPNKKPKSLEHKRRISQSLKGHAVSESTKQKMREAKKKYLEQRRSSNVETSKI